MQVAAHMQGPDMDQWHAWGLVNWPSCRNPDSPRALAAIALEADIKALHDAALGAAAWGQPWGQRALPTAVDSILHLQLCMQLASMQAVLRG